MKLPINWLLTYLDLGKVSLADTTAAACRRWGLEPHADAAHSLGALYTFAGFSCEGVEGSGERAVLELDVLSNRPDALGLVGLAREAAAFLRIGLKLPNLECKSGGERVESLAQVSVEDAALCPRYVARVIRGVKVKPSPAWLQERLTSLGLQPRNNIVDVTNFVLFELNQPLHAFDLKRLAGQRIVVRRAREKEPFHPLYGELPPLTAETLVIADAERPVAVAGVIGGVGSEVSPETTEVLLESACFDSAGTRRACRRLKVGTDASYRFERGVDIEGLDRASARAATLICEVAGGQVAQGVIDTRLQAPPPRVVVLRPERLESQLGVAVPAEAAQGVLEALGCRVKREQKGAWSVEVPSWRRGDLEREADLIEEVARLWGYHHLPARTRMTARIPPQPALERAVDRAGDRLAELGYFECVTDSLVDPRWPAPAVWTSARPIALDPLSVLREDHSLLRSSLLVSLLAVARHNQDRRSGTVRIFENGRVFLPKEGDPSPEERPVLGLVDELGFTALAETLRRLPEALELDEAYLKFRQAPPGQAPEFLTTESACRVVRVRRLDENERAEDVIGWVGCLSPALAKAFDLRRAPAVAELRMDALSDLATAPSRYRALPTQPEVVRDLALVVDERLAWEEIESFVREWARSEPLRDSNEPPRFLSVYRGKQLGAGKKCVAFSVIYRLSDRSLTDEEVNAASGRLVEGLKSKFQATLRA